jgi:hypothetical protein
MSLAVLLALFFSQVVPAHSTHYPKHGGVFFPAAGDTRHVEGVWPRQRLLNVYVYDEDSRPLALERLRAMSGRVVIGTATFPLVLRAHDRMFEARIPTLKIPAELIVELRWPGRAEPEGLQVIFPHLTDVRARTFALEPTVMPRTLAGLLEALRKDAIDGERLIDEGQSAYVFGPAVRAKDHALALDPFVAALAADPRARAESAVRAAVRAAWLLHTAGDDGTIEQTREAAAQLRDAVKDVASLLGPVRR